MTSSSARGQQSPVALVAGLAAVQALPLWLAPYPVMQDLPAHLEMSCQLSHLWQQDPRFSSVLFVHGQPWANSLPTVLLALAPSLALAKVILTLVVIATPVSLAWLFRRMGASPWLALLCVPFTLDLAWSYGFFQFLCAKPLLAMSLALAQRVMTAERHRVREPLALALLLLLTFITHSMVWLVTMVGCTIIVATHVAGHAARLDKSRAPRLTFRAWPLVISALAAAPFFIATRAPASRPLQWRGLTDALTSVWADLGDQRAGALDSVPFVLVAIMVVVLVAVPVLGRSRAAPALGADTRGGRVALGVIAACVALAWLKAPVVLPQVSVVSPRLLSLAVVLAIGLLPTPSARVLTTTIIAAACAVIVQTAGTTLAWRSFARDEMGEFTTLLDKAPANARIATHYASPFSPYGNHNALWHWPKLACLTGASFTDDLFAYRKTAYVELREDARAFQLPAHGLRADALQAYDALLVRGAVPSLAARADLREVGATGTWHLYRVVRP